MSPTSPRSFGSPRRRSATERLTVAEFYRARFEPEHVMLQRPATRESYRRLWRLYIEPAIGGLPLAAIDDDRISTFRAELRKKLAASTANVVLSKVAKMLRFARKVRAIEAVPIVESLVQPRKKPKAVFSDEQITALIAAARGNGTDALVILLLALDAGLRVSEICALRWEDIDLRKGTVLVQTTLHGEKGIVSG